MPTEYELGLLVGLLVGEGHFGGDGKQPQITLRMHVRHEALFKWLEATFPGGKLYGPYDHSGRRYYQWMARGSFLRDELVPLIQSRVVPELDGHAFVRFTEMRSRYSSQLARGPDSVHPLPRDSRSDLPVSTSEGLTGPPADLQDSRGDQLDPPLVDSPAPAGASGEREPPGQTGESNQSVLARAESIFTRMREEDLRGSGG